MHPSIPLLIVSLIYTILVLFLFFSKDKIKTVENKIYTFLLFTVIVGIILDICGIYCHLYLPDTSFIRWLVVKVYLVYLLTFVYLITYYIVVISYKEEMKLIENIKNNKTNRIVKVITFIYVVSIVLNFVLTFTYFKDGNAVYLFGSNTLFIYGMAGLGIISWILMIIRNRKNIPIIKIIPIIIFVIICVPVILLQLSNPEILVVTSLTAFLVNFMYHTIENPDMQTITELYRNKELVEQTYEDKSNFLFELTQEVREPLYSIGNICSNIKDENDINNIKEGLNYINNSIRQLDFIVNDVLNVSTLDTQKVKFINSRYNLRSLFDDVVARIKSNINNENIEFRSNIPNNVPYLYGDSIKLKQILFSLLMNSVKKTNSGFIEFNIQILEKYEVCRVIFSIIDSGSGMSLDKINEILSVTGEFDTNDIKNLEKTEFNIKLCQKIIKSLGGNLLIKSKAGKGTEVMLTIDQRIYNKENDDSILNVYENSLYNAKKVLVVCQDKNITNLLKKKFSEKDINCSFILYGMDAVDKIKSGKKYDYIIVSDDMKEMSGYTTLNEMKKLNKFNTPVIVMLNNSKNEIKEHYLKDGFKDYILLDSFSEEIERIINKY